MNPLNYKELIVWVNDNIDSFHEARINKLKDYSLNDLLKKNPYLLKAKNITTANDVIASALEAKLSSSEEELFGVFLEDLAVYIASQTCKGHKSTAEGMDLEFFHNHIHYLVSIKSGTRWGNSSQQSNLQSNFTVAVRRVKQYDKDMRVEPVLGICYGKTRTNNVRGATKIVGQNFWYFISGDKELYKKIIEPIGYRAREHNEGYLEAKADKINLLTQEFLGDFTNEEGRIDWEKLVEFNAGNLDLDDHLTM